MLQRKTHLHENRIMNLAVPLAGYALTVLIIMFGGRRRRSFNQASQAAAGLTVLLLCIGAILWLLGMVVLHLTNAN
jgi:hypothetical protein